MVSFICNACGNTVKKNQVEKHYATQCKNCSSLSCIDCGVDFAGDTYAGHTSCITEAEKYQGHLYQSKDKENKGETKQKEWLKHVSSASGNTDDPKLKSLLKKLSAYSNIPRKKKKFENFCKNSVNVYDTKTLDQLWNVFNASNEKQDSTATSGTGSDEETKTVAVTANNVESEDNSTPEEDNSTPEEDNSTPEEENAEIDVNNDIKNLELECTQKTKKHKKKKNKTSNVIDNNNESDEMEVDKINEENNDDCIQEEANTKTEVSNDNENCELEFTQKTKKRRKKKNKSSNGDNESEKVDVNNEEDDAESSPANLSAVDVITDGPSNETIESMNFIDHNGYQDNYSYKLKKKKKNRQQTEESVDNVIETNDTATDEPTHKSKKSKKSRKRLNQEIQDGNSKSTDVMVNGDGDDDCCSKKQQKKKKNRKHKTTEEPTKEENVHVKSKKKKRKEEEETIEENKNCEEREEEANAVPQGKFNWHKTIKMILKQNDEHELSVKKLRKKVLAAYQEHGIDHRAATLDESLALFDKKLKTYPKIKIAKDVAKLVK